MVNEKGPKVKVPFYKRWYVMLILGIIIGSVATSGGGSETASTETKVTNEVAETTETTETTSAPAKEEKAPAPKVEEKVPTIVYQDDKVIISFKEVNAEGVKFLMENLTDTELTVQADSVAVNGFSSNQIMMSDAVAPKSKGYITARTSELSDVGTPETVSAGMTVIDFDTMDNFPVTFTNIAIQ